MAGFIRNIFFFFLLIRAGHSTSQSDSLIKAAAHVSKDSAGVMTLYHLGKEYLKTGRYDLALSNLTKALQMGQEINSQYCQAAIMQITGNYYLNTGNDSLAHEYYSKSLDMSKKIKRFSLISANLSQMAVLYSKKNRYLDALNTYKKAQYLVGSSHDTTLFIGIMINMANLYNRMENPERSMAILQDLLRITKRLKEDNYTGHITGNLGNILLAKGDVTDAKEYFMQSLTWARKKNDRYVEGVALSNLASAEKNTDKALRLYSECLELFTSLHDNFEVARVTNNIGFTLLKNKQYEKALGYFTRAADLFVDAKDDFGVCLAHSNISKIYLKLNNVPKAFEFAEIALKEAKQIHSLKLEETASGLLYQVYKKKGDHTNALAFLERNYRLSDSLNSEKRMNALNTQKTKLDLEKQEEILNARSEVEKQKILAKIEKEQIEQKARQNRQILLSSLIGLILAIVSVFSFFLWKRFRIIESQKLLIERQNEMLEEKQKEILDSIHYAKRIQTAMLTSEKYIRRALMGGEK